MESSVHPRGDELLDPCLVDSVRDTRKRVPHEEAALSERFDHDHVAWPTGARLPAMETEVSDRIVSVPEVPFGGRVEARERSEPRRPAWPGTPRAERRRRHCRVHKAQAKGLGFVDLTRRILNHALEVSVWML